MKKQSLLLLALAILFNYSCKKESISNSSLKFKDQAFSFLKSKMSTDDFEILNWQKAKVEFLNGEPVLLKIPSIKEQNVVLLYAASEGKNFVNWVEYDIYKKDGFNYGGLKLKSIDNILLNRFEIIANQIRKIDDDNIALLSNEISLSVDNEYKDLPEIVVTAYKNNNLSNFWSLYWLFNMNDYWAHLYTADLNLLVSATGGGGNSDGGDSESELYNPLFKFPLNNNYAQLYPKFTKLVKTDLATYLKQNPHIIHAIQKLTKLSLSQILSNLIWNKGPVIKIEQLPRDYWGGLPIGKFDPKENLLKINLEDVIKFENSSGVNKEAYWFLLAVTILHEYVHYGDFHYDGIQDKFEIGEKFEFIIYGKLIRDVNDAKKELLFYKNNSSKYE